MSANTMKSSLQTSPITTDPQPRHHPIETLNSYLFQCITDHLPIDDQAAMTLVSKSLLSKSDPKVFKSPLLHTRDPAKLPDYDGWPKDHTRENFLKALDGEFKDTERMHCTECKVIHTPTSTIDPDLYHPFAQGQDLHPCVKVAREIALHADFKYNGIKFPFLAIQKLMRDYNMGNMESVRNILIEFKKFIPRPFTERSEPAPDFGDWTPQVFNGSWSVNNGLELKIVDGNLLLKRQQTFYFENDEQELLEFPPTGIKIKFCPHHRPDDASPSLLLPNSLFEKTYRSLAQDHRHIQTGNPLPNSHLSSPNHTPARGCEICKVSYDITGRLVGKADFEMTFTSWQGLGKGVHPLEDEWIVATSTKTQEVYAKREERKELILHGWKLLNELGYDFNDHRYGIDDARRLFGDACLSCGDMLDISTTSLSCSLEVEHKFCGCCEAISEDRK